MHALVMVSTEFVFTKKTHDPNGTLKIKSVNLMTQWQKTVGSQSIRKIYTTNGVGKLHLLIINNCYWSRRVCNLRIDA